MADQLIIVNPSLIELSDVTAAVVGAEGITLSANGEVGTMAALEVARLLAVQPSATTATRHAWVQRARAATVKRLRDEIRALRLTSDQAETIRLDGLLTEAFWQQAGRRQFLGL